MRHAFALKVMAAAALLTTAAACQTTGPEEMPVSGTLPTMAGPADFPVGTVLHVAENGETMEQELVAVEGTRWTWRRSDGCSWTRDTANGAIVSPSLSWSGCTTSGSQEIAEISGAIWPLKLGAKVTYTGTGTTEETGNTWTADRTCEATGTARIQTGGGAHDTYKVVCTTEWRRLTYYIAPDVGFTVHSVQEPLRADSNATPKTWDLVRVERPASS